MSTKSSVPSYRRHKQSGQAVVTLPDGLGGRKDVLLGHYGTQKSRMEYARVIAEWEAAGQCLPQSQAAEDLTIKELIVAYWKHAEKYYRHPDGTPTGEIACLRAALRPLKELYGQLAAKDFGPLALRAVRQRMIDYVDERTKRHWCRRTINLHTYRIRSMFRWAVANELIPSGVLHGLQAVRGLQKGRSEARESEPVKPVPEAFVEAVLAHVPPMVKAMIEVQRLCGGRPQDIVAMRAIDIDMTRPVWEYRPPRYKTEHHTGDDSARERVVFLGPRAQELLKPYLSLDVNAYLFSPSRSEANRNACRRENRKTPLWPSHRRRARKQRGHRRAHREHYDVAAYRRAIHRGCDKAEIARWSPHRLRHSRGTEIRKLYGLEAAQAVLGHADLGTTQVYAEADRETARRIMGTIG